MFELSKYRFLKETWTLQIDYTALATALSWHSLDAR